MDSFIDELRISIVPTIGTEYILSDTFGLSNLLMAWTSQQTVGKLQDRDPG
jgi:hypothetical protein